jgi:hypothetical protein
LLLVLLGPANVHRFRYRLTVDIEADGKTHSASSIIDVTYRIGDDGMKRWNHSIRGVAPIVDLGQYGSIVAALGYWKEDTKFRERGKQLGKANSLPEGAELVPLGAYNLGAETISSAKGQAVVDRYYPNFIWVPPSGDWRQAIQIWPEDFASTIAPSVRLAKVTVEVTPKAPVVTRVVQPPPWLEKFRADQPDLASVSGSLHNFTFHRYSFIEREH